MWVHLLSITILFTKASFKLMKYQLFFAAMAMVLAGMITGPALAAVTSVFGSGANQFTMTFERVGNPGNAADLTGVPRPVGSVGYGFLMGKFEVSRDMITKFNASQSLNVSLQDMSSFGGGGPNKPATGVTWNEAARFVNWLSTSTGSNVAYNYFDGNVNDDTLLWDPVLNPLDLELDNAGPDFFWPSFFMRCTKEFRFSLQSRIASPHRPILKVVSCSQGKAVENQ
jgi:hypothetical protein